MPDNGVKPTLPVTFVSLARFKRNMNCVSCVGAAVELSEPRSRTMLVVSVAKHVEARTGKPGMLAQHFGLFMLSTRSSLNEALICGRLGSICGATSTGYVVRAPVAGSATTSVYKVPGVSVRLG